MEREEPKSILSLALSPLHPREGILARPIRVYSNYSTRLQDLPDNFNPDDSRWIMSQSSKDYRKTNELLNDLQDARVAGRSLIEFLSYNGVSMWQFLPAYLWPFFFRAVELIDVVLQLVEDVKPKEIRVFPVSDYTDPIWQGVVQSIGDRNGIRVTQLGHPLSKQYFRMQVRGILREIGVGRALRWLGRLHLNLRVFLFSRRVPPHTTHRASKRLLLVTLGKRHWVPVLGDPSRKHDEQMSPLLPLLRLSGWRDFLLIDCEDSSQSELNARMEDGEPDVSWRAFSSYMEKNSKTQEQSRIVFREMLHTLKTDQEFLADFRYRNVTLMPALGIELEKAFHLRLPRCAAMLDAASQILAEERPSAVIATYETGPWARAIIIQASRAGIPTLGLQHGMIFDNHYDYMHRRVTVDPANNPIGFALPNVTCVWGPFWKEVLTESGHYPREAVAVTGNWRYDHISEMMTMDVQEAKRQLEFPEDSRIVLVLSAGLNTLDFIRLCLETISKRPDCSPMIKLHPGSDSPGPVRELLSKLGFPLSILIEGRLHESILSADLVISQISTAVGEAALLNRPVVLANLENLAGAEAYVESGICLYATDPDQLAVAVGKGLDDAQTLGQLAQARKEFVSRYFYKLDGCASQRVAETLRQSIQAQGNG